MSQVLTEELFRGLDDSAALTRILVRLFAACFLAGVMGFERQREGKTAGLRTHMLVGLGSAVFTMVASLYSPSGDATRVLQGVASGIGFLGAGTILKAESQRQIHGLTSAAGIWLTAATGAAVGVGYAGPAILATVFGYVILEAMHRLEITFHVGDRTPANSEHHKP